MIENLRNQSVISNETLFSFYRDRLFLGLWGNTNRLNILSILTKFEWYCGGKPPTRELADSFLHDCSAKKSSTIKRYRSVVDTFMNWYSDAHDDVFEVSRGLVCRMVEHPVKLLLNTIHAKKTHKKTIERDSLLIELAWETGMTRGELAALKVEDIKGNYLLIRNPSSGIDRMIQLSRHIVERLQIFTQNKTGNSTLFNLKAPCVSGKINRIAKKANLESVHLGFFRHEFAAKLFQGGTAPDTVQMLLGHKKLASTKNYFPTIPPQYSEGEC